MMTPAKKAEIGDKVLHPGIVLLQKYMEPKSINANHLSLDLRVPQNRMWAIVQGRRGISPDTALRLARFFCTTPEYWLDLQRAYDLDRAKAEVGDAIAEDVRDGCGGKKRV